MSLRRLLAWALAGHACLLLVSLRHNFVWGEGRELLGIEVPLLLGIAEGVGLTLFALLAGIPYARAACRAQDFDPATITRGGVVLVLAATLAPPCLSTDVFDNLARGRVESVHGANPYTMPPAQFPEDPFTQKANWTKFGNPYGPVSSLVQAGVTGVSGDRVWIGVYVFKLLCALCHIATALCLWRAAKHLRPERAPLVYYLYLWNPWILVETAGNAHNDALLALGVAAAMWALAGSRTALATAAFGLAVLTKHSAAVLGPPLLALAWRRGQLAGFAIGVAITAALTAPLVGHYFMEPGAIDALIAQAGHQRTSLQYLLATLIGTNHGSTLTIAGYVLAALFMAWCLPGIRDASSFGRQAARVVVFFLVVGMPMFSPWYHLWWLPLVAVWAWAGWLRVFAWVSVLCPLSYLVFVTTRELGDLHQVWMWAVGLLPVALLVLTTASEQPRASRSSAAA